RRYRRPLLLRLEHTHRPTLEDYVHRATRLGSSRSLNLRIGYKSLMLLAPLSETVKQIVLLHSLCRPQSPAIAAPRTATKRANQPQRQRNHDQQWRECTQCSCLETGV